MYLIHSTLSNGTAKLSLINVPVIPVNPNTAPTAPTVPITLHQNTNNITHTQESTKVSQKLCKYTYPQNKTNN